MKSLAYLRLATTILAMTLYTPMAALAAPSLSQVQPEVLPAYRVTGAIQVDGDLAEWPALIPLNDEQIPDWYTGQNLRVWQGRDDGQPLGDDWRGEFAFAWDDEYLYFAGNVTDDLYWVEWNEAANFPRGDRFRLYLDVLGTNDPTPSDWQYMLLINPLGIAISPMNASDDSKGIVPKGVKLAARMNGESWSIEVAIPKDSLPPLKLEAGRILGVDVVMDDYDMPRTRTHCIAYFGGPDHWTTAANWGKMELQRGAGNP